MYLLKSVNRLNEIIQVIYKIKSKIEIDEQVLLLILYESVLQDVVCPLIEYNTYIYRPSRHYLQDGYIHDSYLQDGYIHTQLHKTVNYKTHYTGRFLLVLLLRSPRVPYINSNFHLSPRVTARSISNLVTGNGYIS